MFAMSTPEITLFQSMYDAEDKSPSILDSLSYVINPPNSIHGNDNSLFLADDNFISNYPNPFNNTTRIIYNIAAGNSANVSLRIFNNKGESVLSKELNNSSNSFNRAFSGSFFFDGKNRSSGVYYVKVFSGDVELASSKLMLLK